MKKQYIIPPRAKYIKEYYEKIYAMVLDEIDEYTKRECFVCKKDINCIGFGGSDVVFHIKCFDRVKKLK